MTEFDHESEKDGAFFYSKVEPGTNKPEFDLKKKIALSKIDETLTVKAEQRDRTCWSFDCNNPPMLWVREVQFDMYGDKVGTDNHVVSTRDYEGPIPGFCSMHVGNGPAQLAEAVYWDRTEIYLGLRPRKWWVIFTDGTKQGGLCEVLNPKDLKPSTLDLHIKSSGN